MSKFYLPSRVITRALADSRPQHVAFKTWDVSRKRGIKRNSIKWITKAKRLL